MDNILNQLFSEKLTSALYVQGSQNIPSLEYDIWLYNVANYVIFISIIICTIMIFLAKQMFSKNKEKNAKIILYLTAIPLTICVCLILYLSKNVDKINNNLVYNPIVSVRGVDSNLIDYYRSFNDKNYNKTQQFIKSDFLSAEANKFLTPNNELFCGVVLRPKNFNKPPITLNLMTFQDLNIQGCKSNDPVIE